MRVRESSLELYQAYVKDLDPESSVDQAVMLLLDDVTDRRGWDGEWDAFDDSVKTTIIESWRRLLTSALQAEQSDKMGDLREVVDGLYRRAKFCRQSEGSGSNRERLIAKASAYEHAGQLVEAVLDRLGARARRER